MKTTHSNRLFTDSKGSLIMDSRVIKCHQSELIGGCQTVCGQSTELQHVSTVLQRPDLHKPY